MLHLSFGVRDVALSGAFYDAAAPGLRARYGPCYYAAFLVDPDGYRIEAVCQAAGQAFAAT